MTTFSAMMNTAVSASAPSAGAMTMRAQTMFLYRRDAVYAASIIYALNMFRLALPVRLWNLFPYNRIPARSMGIAAA